MQPLTQRVDVGVYILEAQVDEGEFSGVYYARHRYLGTTHAMKLLHAGQDMPIRDALALEGRLQSHIRHPNVVRVTDAGVWRDRPFLVSDWIDGEPLADRIDREGAMSQRAALTLFRGLARGIHAMHRMHVVHRDLKPSNVLLQGTKHPVPMIIDFGLAKPLTPGQAPAPEGLSAEFQTLGTPEYMAPEQMGRAGEVDLSADVWSLGVLLYELLTDELPFEGEEPWDVNYLAVLGKYTPMRSHDLSISVKVEELVASMLKPKPEERLRSAREVLARLDALRA